MNNKKLNVVYIGQHSFPIGGASTKRRRYMVDYMNAHNMHSYYLISDFKQRSQSLNPVSGEYGKCTFYDISPLAAKKCFASYWKKGKFLLKNWFEAEAKNVLIFPTVLTVFEYPFYTFAREIGYKIVFDQVETSYLEMKTGNIIARINSWMSEKLSKTAYSHSSAFVISSQLYNENIERYPCRKLCVLPNSTPIINSTAKEEVNSPIKLLYSGTYAPKDGVSFLLEGVNKAYKRGVRVELFMTGKGNCKDMQVIEPYIKKPYIHYLGFVQDSVLNKLLCECDLLCMTRTNSRFANYGFPFKLSEYLATNNIVLATKVGDVCSYLEDRISAYIVSPENSDEIADVIEEIVKNPAEALDIARHGFAVMQQYFSIDEVGAKFTSFLYEV